jgi:hypothetical protein
MMVKKNLHGVWDEVTNMQDGGEEESTWGEVTNIQDGGEEEST